MRYTGPKTRLCRREGVNLHASPKYSKIMARRPGIPGMHGGKRMAKVTEYGRQLREKQKAKRMYGLSEKQFFKYVTRAMHSKDVTSDVLFLNLETRLDNVLFRAGFALTRAQGRQFASHGLFHLNGRRTDVPSAQVRAGDVIEVHPSKKGSPVFAKNLEELESYDAPSWLKVDPKSLKIEILELPGSEHFEQLIEPRMIIEFYSR